MHSGQYDKDCVTWNPQGEIPQINYVLNAVTNGTVVAGARSKKFVVLAGYKKRPQPNFSSYDEKLFKVDHHCGIGIAGLTADARVLSEYMRSECLHHKYVFDEPMPIGRLVAQIGDKAQQKTLNAGKRPYGVGLLVQSWDNDNVARLHEFAPSGDWYEYNAIAIGARAQSAKTYLEKNYESFTDMGADELIRHVIKSISVGCGFVFSTWGGDDDSRRPCDEGAGDMNIFFEEDIVDILRPWCNRTWRIGRRRGPPVEQGARSGAGPGD